MVIIITIAAFAQSGITLTGRLVNAATEEGIAYCPIGLFRADTTMVAGVLTDQEGRFRFENLQPADYIIGINQQGFIPMLIPVKGISQDSDMGEVLATPATQQLSEVTVIGASSVQAASKEILYPTEGQLAASSNALALMANLQIPRVSVNPATREIATTSGDEIQLRINGVIVQATDVVALAATDVIRVEWYDGPTLKYEGAEAVLNFVVRQRIQGAYLAIDGTQAISRLGLGEYTVAASAFSGSSSWSFNMYAGQRHLDISRDNIETFHLPSGTVTNVETSEKTPFAQWRIRPQLAYTYQTEKQMLTARFNFERAMQPRAMTDRDGTLRQNDKEYKIYDNEDGRYTVASADIYWQSDIGHSQNLFLDIVGTYIPSHYKRDYRLDDFQIYTDITGHRYSLIGEALYEKKWGATALTAGMKYEQGFSKMDYTNNTLVLLRSSQEYGFAQIASRFKKFSFTIGMGTLRMSEHQGDVKSEKWIPRPQLDLGLQVHKLFIKYNGYVSGYAPGIAQLSSVTRQIDPLQWQRGNPCLKGVTFFSNQLSLTWKPLPILNFDLTTAYIFDHKPIMDKTVLDGEMVVRTYENQRGFHRLRSFLAIQAFPWKQYLQVTITPFFNRYISQGNGYEHSLSNWGFRGEILAQCKGWFMSADIRTRTKDLFGETVTQNASSHNLTVGFRHAWWSLRITALSPFNRQWSMKTMDLSQIAPSQQICYSNTLQPIWCIGGSVNLDFGTRRTAGFQRLQNSDTEVGVATGAR